MPASLDFLITPVLREQGTDRPDLPALCAASPPRRVGRGRSQDRLVMHLGVQGNAPLSEKSYAKLFETLTATYYKTAGPSTTAMRAVAEALNQSLFRRNQRVASRGLRAVGLFSMAVFRGERLYLAQCGPVRALLVRADGIQHFSNPDAAGRGLGMGRVAPLQYHQAEIAPGDLLILSPALPAAWLQPGIQSLHGQLPEQVVPQLRATAGDTLEAVLIQVTPGEGRLTVLSRAGDESRQSLADPPRAAAREVPPPKVESPPVGPARRAAPQVAAKPDATPPPQDPESPPPERAASPKKPKQPAPIFAALLVMLAGLRRLAGRFLRALGALLQRMLPDERALDLPPSLMLFIAVAVPVVLVTVASVVYFREGRARLHQEQLAQARLLAEQTLALDDPLAQRAGWEQTLAYLNAAEAYGASEDSRQIRRFVYTQVDALDKTERLHYQPLLVDALPADAKITRMVLAGEDDLYLLNETNGHVLRATFSDAGYALDPAFICEPIPAPFVVGPLVDIVPLPLGEPDGATVMGLDANGMLLRCVPGEEKGPNVKSPVPPDINWGAPQDLTLDNGNLYILDPKTNAVWIYWAIDDYQEVPTYYFGNQVPSLQGILDMAVSNGDLYLLHDSGEMTRCVYRPYVDAPTICDDPAPYDDDRTGYADGAVMQGTDFRQIQYMPPPDPSIYLLDPAAEAIYHFSLQLKYQRQYRPDAPLPAAPTAFFVAPDQRIFLVAGGQVYVAVMP